MILRRGLIAALLYALLIGVLMLPATTHLSTVLIGNNVDNWIFYWNTWWLETALREGHAWFTTPYAFFPQGVSLVTHSNSWLTSLMALPFQAWLGPLGAYNAALLLGLWLGAVGTFLLVDEMTGDPQAALLAGFVFAFAPYHLTRVLAQAHLGGIHWWSYYALCLRRALAPHPPRRALPAIGAGLCAALTLWTGPQLAVLLALWTLFYAGWRLRATPHAELRASFGALAVVGCVAVLLSLPVLLPLLRAGRDLAASTSDYQLGLRDQTNLLAYILPPTYHPWVGDALNPIYARFVKNRAFMPYLGYGALALTALALWRGPREARFWGFSAALWILLAAGAAPRFNEHVYESIPLPYRWLEPIFPISTLRAPDRFNLLVVFSLAVLVGWGSARVIAVRRRAWLIPLSLLLLMEYLCLPIPAWEPLPDSPFYARMAEEPPDYGVVSYPMGYTHAKLWLYYQTRHEKPLVEAHLSRYTPDTYATILDNAVLRALYAATPEQIPPLLPTAPFEEQAVPVPALGPALRDLREQEVRYVLAHIPYTTAETQAHLRRVLPFVPVYADETLHVYDLRAPFARRYAPWPVTLAPDLALAHFDARPAGERWEFAALLLARDADPLPRRCEIALEDVAGKAVGVGAGLTFFAAPGTWQADDVDYQEVALTLPEIAPGDYRWALRCADAAAYLAPKTLTIAEDASPPTYLRERVDAVLGDIRLNGYRWRTDGATLRVTLAWEALAAPEADYVAFVHLLDAAGHLVAQHDAMPCAWACPTGGWAAGDRIADEIPLFVGHLPPGAYHLSVGLYDPATGIRLPTQQPDDAVRLSAPLRIVGGEE